MGSDSEQSSKVIKAGLGYTIGNYLIKGLSFITLPIFTRMMSTGDYGIYNSFSAYSNLLFVLAGIAIHSSYRNAKLKYKPLDNYYSYISTTMIMILINMVVWSILGIFFATSVGEVLGLNTETTFILIGYSFSLAVITCFNVYSSIEYKYQAFLFIAGINAISSIIASIYLIKYVFVKHTYIGRVLGTAIPSILIAIGIIIYFFSLERPKLSKARSYLTWGIKYSLPIVPHGISQLILAQFDRIMILKIIGSATAGVYSFAYNIFSIVTVTTTSLDNVWSTWFYEQMDSGNNHEIKKYSSWYAMGILVYSVSLMLISPELVKILGTKEYTESIYAIIPLITGGFFAFLYTLPAAVEYYYEKTKYIMFGTIFAAIINIILNLLFLSKYGYVIAAYNTLVTYMIYFLLHYILAKKIAGKSLFSLKKLAFFSISIIIMNFVTIAILKNILLRWGIAIIIIVIALIIEERKLGLLSRKFKNYF